MENQELNRKQNVTGKNDFNENIIDWAGKIKVLGGVLSALAWYEHGEHGGSLHLQEYGEDFGRIIKDYAELIENAVTDDMPVMRSLGECVEAHLARHQA